MVTILITGGAGFIGTNLKNELRQRGHDVWIADIRGSEDPQSYRCDVGEYRQLERIFEERKFDVVYNAAAEYGRWNGEDFYENLWQTNAVGTKNVLTLAAKHKFRVVQFSSAEVYGDQTGVITEDITYDRHIHLLNDYAMTKWVNEMQVLNATARFGIEAVRVRPVNVYGPHESYSPYRGVVPIFIHQLLHKQPITVYRGHTRIFDYVDDTAATLANIVDRFRPGEFYHMGGKPEWERSIESIAKLILDHLGMDDSLVVYKGEDTFTTKFKRIDNSKAEKHLGHNPSVPPEVGIPRTVDWHRTQMKLRSV